MSHKVIDLASDEEKEKAGPIDLANSSDEDVEDREDLQVACPKCTLLNAGDADQCVACGNQLRASRWDREDRAGASGWGRADGTPWSQKPKTGGFRIPTRSDVDAPARSSRSSRSHRDGFDGCAAARNRWPQATH